jgi:5,10-methylenetetrahydromethanopterin reductase
VIARAIPGLGVGTAVVPINPRHPLLVASAAQTAQTAARGNFSLGVAVAFGTGFAGARTLGAKPASWSFLRDYVRAFRGLLNGDTVDWDGSRMQMMRS